MSITIIIIIATVVASLVAFRDGNFRNKWIHNPYTVYHRKEYWRLLTSGFIHADYMHLFFNMYAMYLFGKAVEGNFGYFFGEKAGVYFLGLYLSGIVVANLPDLIQKKNQAYFNSLGASGGVSSIVFCSVILEPLNKLMMFPIPVPMPAYIFAAIYIAYSIYMEKRQMDNVNHMAHLWGGVWGVAFIAFTKFETIPAFYQQILSSF